VLCPPAKATLLYAPVCLRIPHENGAAGDVRAGDVRRAAAVRRIQTGFVLVRESILSGRQNGKGFCMMFLSIGNA